MNNFLVSLKKFFKNKNTVTVLGIILILGILYWGYSSAINKATNPVTVPVAAKKIAPYTKITSSDIKYVKMPNTALGTNVIRLSMNIINKYTNLNVTIPEGSLFFSDWLVSESNLPGKWIDSVKFKKGEEAYYLNVSTVSTLGNSVIPGSYIDIYMKANNTESGLVEYGKLLENIKVLVAHDSNGNDVFSDTTSQKSTSYLGFALSQEYYLLLKKAEYLSQSGIELVIAPHGTAVGKLGDVTVRSQDLRDYVNAKTAEIDTDKILATQSTTTTTATE